MIWITPQQQDRIVMAAVDTLDVSGEDEARAVCNLIKRSADDANDLPSLLAVFNGMMRALSAELKVMNFEAGDEGPPPLSQH
jgi:hypothetical protein